MPLIDTTIKNAQRLATRYASLKWGKRFKLEDRHIAFAAEREAQLNR